MKPRKKQVLFIVPTALGISPSQRFRFEHYLPILAENGIGYTVSPYFSTKGRRSLYSRKLIIKIAVILKGYFKRLGFLFLMLRYDYVFIHREAAPIGPPIIPWFAAKVFGKKIIYDFDDAIWLPLMSDFNKKFSFVKSFTKVKAICQWSHIVVVGNEYLRAYASQYNPDVRIIPTVVNTQESHNKLQDQMTDKPAIGWTGSFSTLTYLDIVLPVLVRLQEKFDFIFYVIADIDPGLPLKNYRFIPWNKETEVEDLLRFHIGVMPLYDDEFSKGKCGFKAIQYMSLGIPALVSPVGVNSEIVSNGVDGFICTTEMEWENNISQLLENSLLRQQMGISARSKIENNYSVDATKPDFLALFGEEK